MDWTENGNQVSTSASYTFTLGGNRLLDANFTQVTGIEQAFGNITVYPNPSTGKVNIASAGGLQAKVFNALGQMVMAFAVTEPLQAFDLPETGLYWMQLQDANGKRYCKSLLIER